MVGKSASLPSMRGAVRPGQLALNRLNILADRLEAIEMVVGAVLEEDLGVRVSLDELS